MTGWTSRARRILRNRLRPETRLRLWVARRYRDPRFLVRPQLDLEREHLERIYEIEQGRPLDLDAPRSFSEKIQWRKLFDRREVFTRMADKVEVRDYVAARVGDQYLIPLLAVADTTAGLPFGDLDPPYIVKPTHASGLTERVRDRSELDPDQLAKSIDPAVRDPYGIRNIEWAYWSLPGRVMVERLLLRPDGRVPFDYKVYVFGGRARFVEVHIDRYRDRKTSIFDTDWSLTDAGYPGRESGGAIERPGALDQMLELAEALARGTDYLRVDLYLLDGQIYVGELTLYPASGFRRFDPPEWDFRWGELWDLPEMVRRP